MGLKTLHSSQCFISQPIIHLIFLSVFVERGAVGLYAWAWGAAQSIINFIFLSVFVERGAVGGSFGRRRSLHRDCGGDLCACLHTWGEHIYSHLLISS